MRNMKKIMVFFTFALVFAFITACSGPDGGGGIHDGNGNGNGNGASSIAVVAN